MDHTAIMARNGALGEVRRLWRIATKRRLPIPFPVLEQAVHTLMLYLLRAKNVPRPAYDERTDAELTEELAFAFFLFGREHPAHRLRNELHEELRRRAGVALLYRVSSQIDDAEEMAFGPDVPSELFDVPDPLHVHPLPVRVSVPQV